MPNKEANIMKTKKIDTSSLAKQIIREVEEENIENEQRHLETELKKTKIEENSLKKDVNNIQKVVNDIILGEDYDAYYDKYSVPKEILEAYPEMNFHFVACTPEKISSAMAKRYQVVHIPQSCKDLLAIQRTIPRIGITNAFGDDTIVIGLSNILMMCPKIIYDKRKKKLEEMRQRRTKKDVSDQIESIKSIEGIKSVNIHSGKV